MIFSTRRAWRPPSNSVVRKVRTISSAITGPMVRAPMATMLASLCWRERAVDTGSEHSAQRTPWILLAEMEMPMPVPQISTPLSHSPDTTALATFSA